MKVANFLKNSFILLGELAIFIVALSWFYNCNNNNNDDCHEPLIAVIGSSLPLIVGLLLRLVDWFKKSEIKKYCESLYKQFKDVDLPLVSKQTLQSLGPDYSLAKSIPISDIYIDLPLQTLKQPTNTFYPQKNKAQILNFKLIKGFQRIKRFWGKKPKQKKNSFFEYGIKTHTDFTPSSIISTSSISGVLDKEKKIIIVGDRGCGKSTLLSYLAYTYSYQLADPKNFNRDRATQLPKIKWVPIIIPCGNLNLTSSTSFSVILRQHLSGNHFSTAILKHKALEIMVKGVKTSVSSVVFANKLPMVLSKNKSEKPQSKTLAAFFKPVLLDFTLIWITNNRHKMTTIETVSKETICW